MCRLTWFVLTGNTIPTELGGDPMRDYRRPIGVGHRTDPIEAFLVTGGDPLVLT